MAYRFDVWATPSEPAASGPPAPCRVDDPGGDHKFVQAAAALVREGSDAAKADTWIQLLHDQAHLAEGEVPDPKGTVARIQAVLDALAGP